MVPSPSCPWSFLPHAHTDPSFRVATMWLSKVEIDVTPVRPLTAAGAHRPAEVVPSPSWPESFAPHAHTVPSDRSTWVTESTATINNALAARYRNGGEVTYLDIGHVFMRDGRLNAGLFFDPKLTPPEPPLHPTPEGQALMAAAIEPTLAGLLGDRPHIAAR